MDAQWRSSGRGGPGSGPGRAGTSFLVEVGGFGGVVLGFFDHGGGAARAVPGRTAARAGRGLLRQEFGKVEGGLGGGDAHGSVLSGQSGWGGGGGALGRPMPRATRPVTPPVFGGLRGVCAFCGGKDRGSQKMCVSFVSDC